MFKIKVISNNIVTNAAKFNTENECLTWYNSQLQFFPQGHTYNIENIQSEIDSQNALEYLKETDWYIIRELDSGVACPNDIKIARALARTKVI